LLKYDSREKCTTSVWTQKYQRYKELQRKIDENLDYDMNYEK